MWGSDNNFSWLLSPFEQLQSSWVDFDPVRGNAGAPGTSSSFLDFLAALLQKSLSDISTQEKWRPKWSANLIITCTPSWSTEQTCPNVHKAWFTTLQNNLTGNLSKKMQCDSLQAMHFQFTAMELLFNGMSYLLPSCLVSSSSWWKHYVKKANLKLVRFPLFQWQNCT